MNLTFFGATGEVTGSCFVLSYGDHKVLIECGLIQGSRQHEKHNREKFPFDIREIDAVLLTHAHLDHSGRLPLLIKRGYTGQIHTHHATRDLCKVMLADAGFLNEREAQWENKKHQHDRRGEPMLPIYSRKEALESIDRFIGHNYEESIEVCPGLRCVFHDAGHILGSACIELIMVQGQQSRRIVFSGDLGNPGAPLLRDPSVPMQADLVVLESTYGDRLHRDWDATWTEIGEVIASANSSKGNILIPAFTVGRTQALLYAFREHYDAWGLNDWKIVLDTPMGIEATEIYGRYSDLYDDPARHLFSREGDPFNLPNLFESRTTDDSMRMNELDAGIIVIAGSGMCTGGRIRHHLRHNISRPQAHVMIVGFQARGTTGRMLVDGAQTIRLFGQEYPVRAGIHTIGGLSAHADQEDLCDWFGAIGGNPACAIVHGEPEASLALETRLSENGSQRIIRPEFGQQIDLTDMKLRR